MSRSQPIRAARGVRDILPDELEAWNRLECRTRGLLERFGYREIAVPIIEPAELVQRVGESTDVVQKEMYRFEDQGGRSMVLRPEATASVVRAYFQGGLNQGPQPARLWLTGPMFRYGRPQAGRYRQFHQLDVEVVGDGSAAVDAEIVEVAWSWLESLGLQDLELKLNTIGDPTCRPAYREALLAYYRPLRDQLCADCRRRMEINPLRMLDCKEEREQELRQGAPRMIDFLCDECSTAFEEVKRLLSAAGIPFTLDPLLVRGLDYYTRTTFEVFPAGSEGSQTALLGGGRYDGLAAELGYPDTPAVGFAAGIERVLAAVAEAGRLPEPRPAGQLLVVPEGGSLSAEAAEVARIARQALPTAVDYSDRGLRAKLRSAGRQGVRWVALLNADEARRRVVKLRDMSAGEQEEVSWEDLAHRLKASS